MALSNFEYAERLRAIAVKRNLRIDDEVLIAVQQNGRHCVCRPADKCPCNRITDLGCPCELYLPKE